MNLVSIIVPVFNAAAFIEECIESILSQTYKDIELILADDNSSDLSVSICDRLARKHSNVILLRQLENIGPMASRVNGINHAKGDFIVFCDADDRLPIDCIEKLMTALGVLNSDMIIGNFAQQYGERIIDNKSRLEIGVHKTSDLLLRQIDDGCLSGMLISSQCAKLYKKSIINSYIDKLPLDVRINEDGVFNTYYLLHSMTVGVINERVYIQRNWKLKKKNEDININKFESANRALLQLKNRWPDQQNFEKQMQLRQLTILFWLSIDVCYYYGLKTGKRHLEKMWNDLDFHYLSENIDTQKMRSYKRFLKNLMQKKMYIVFYVCIRWITPILRKRIAR